MYNEKLDREEQERKDRLEATYARQEKLMNLGIFAQKSTAQKLKEDEIRAKKYAEIRSNEEYLRDKAKEVAVKKRNHEMKKKILEQIQKKEERRKEEEEEKIKIAQTQKREYEEYYLLKKQKQIEKRRQKLSYKEV